MALNFERLATIATHNGTQIATRHNRRERKCVEKESHIDLSKPHENWIDKDIREVYQEEFGAAIQEYNEKQKRKDRRINDYYAHINKDKQKHVAYEMIIGVYSDQVDEETQREILKKFVDTWEERNPNLKLIGAYYHADEKGDKGPHCHIDYVPVGKYDKGLKVRNGLNQAIEQQGFINDGYGNTAQKKWNKAENEALESICKEYGITVIHPQAGKTVEHLKKAEYIQIQEKLEMSQKITNNIMTIMKMIKEYEVEYLKSKELTYLKEQALSICMEEDMSYQDMKGILNETDQLVKDMENTLADEYDIEF